MCRHEKFASFFWHVFQSVGESELSFIDGHLGGSQFSAVLLMWSA